MGGVTRSILEPGRARAGDSAARQGRPPLELRLRRRGGGARFGHRHQGARRDLLTPGQPASIVGETVTWTWCATRERRSRWPPATRGCHPGRHRRGLRHHLDGSAAGVSVVGARSRDDSRWRHGQSRGPVLPVTGAAARPRCGLPVDRVVAGVQRGRPSVVVWQSCWCCRCSVLTSTPSGGDGWRRIRGDEMTTQIDARSGRTGRHAGRRRPGPAAGAVAHSGRPPWPRTGVSRSTAPARPNPTS